MELIIKERVLHMTPGLQGNQKNVYLIAHSYEELYLANCYLIAEKNATRAPIVATASHLKHRHQLQLYFIYLPRSQWNIFRTYPFHSPSTQTVIFHTIYAEAGYPSLLQERTA